MIDHDIDKAFNFNIDEEKTLYKKYYMYYEHLGALG